MKPLTLCVATLAVIACGTAPKFVEVTDPNVELPDLRIKKIEYRLQHRQQIARRSIYEPNVAALGYEFTIFIENVGNSVTKS